MLVSASYAQRFGGISPTAKWSQIKTDTARIIFPHGLDSIAQRVAHNVHEIASLKPVTLGNALKRIYIVLQNKTTVPNGYVSLGPYRSELYLTPMVNNFDMGSIAWVDQLSIHEYRHVQQYANFIKGGSKFMYRLAGEDGLSLAINAAIPEWFYEGDAVYLETLLTQQGRGRLPYFMNEFPALWAANKHYRWMKIRNGSYKDYVPNHYQLGYLLVNYGYKKYGTDFWKQVTQRAASYQSLFYPFQQAIKKEAQVSFTQFVKDAFAYYQAGISSNTSPLVTTTNNKHNKVSYTNETSPALLDNGTIIVQKSSYNKRPAFYERDGGKDKIIAYRNISIDDQFNYRNGKIIYCAYEKNPRWHWTDYSTIKIIDTKTKEQLNLTKKSKYFMPDLSPDGNTVVAIENNELVQSKVVLFNATTGDVLKKIEAHAISTFTNPRFINNDSIVMVVKLPDGKCALAVAEVSTGNITRLTPPSYNVAGNPYCRNGYIYFTASYGSNNNLYRIAVNDPSTILLIEESNTGLYTPTANDSLIASTTFTPIGFKTVTTPILPYKNKTALTTNIEKLDNPYTQLFAAQRSVALPNTGSRNFAIQKYSPSTKFFNIHSWRPNYTDPEFSFTLYGNNVLNTTLTNLYYLYNRNNGAHAVGFDFAYGKWFPYIQAGTQYWFNNSSYNTQVKKYRYWNQLETSLGLNIPLYWVKGKTYRDLNLTSFFHTRNDYNTGVTKSVFKPVEFTYLSHSISYAQYVQQSLQHIYPRLGYKLSATNRHAVSGYKSWQWLTQATAYLPGIFNNHSLVLNGSWQAVDTTTVLFSNNISYARGFESAYLPRTLTLKANYHFPLCYPDVGAFNILYVLRMRANVFFDHTLLHSLRTGKNYYQQSTGIEIFADTKWWNQYPLTLGFRISNRLQTDLITAKKGLLFEWVLPVSIIPN